MGSSKDDLKRDFLAENSEPMNLSEIPLRELIEEIRMRPGVKAFDAPAEGQFTLSVHSSRRIVNDSTLLAHSEDAGPATFLKIGVATKHETTRLKLRIARAIDEELYLPLKAEVERTPYTSRLGFLKERLKQQVEKILDEEDK
jgi:hypothetical protein